MEQKELHTITGSLNRSEMEQKMCNPNILGSYIKFYHPPNFTDPFLPFLLSPPPPPPSPSLSVSSHRSSNGQEPHSQWVQRVPFQSLAAVIFQLARCSPSCQSVTDGSPGLYCTCAAVVERLRTSHVSGQSESLTVPSTFFFVTVCWFRACGELGCISLHFHSRCGVLISYLPLTYICTLHFNCSNQIILLQRQQGHNFRILSRF